MGKNYFTDEQIEAAAKSAGLLENTVRGLAYTFADDEKLKSLMNLAVEAVIGEKVGFLIKHFDGEYELDFN